MKTIKLYTAEELKKKHPKGFDYALNHFQNSQDEIFWTDEIMDSLKAIFKASGIRLLDWSIGAYSYSSIRFDMEKDTRELSGVRAQAWLENNLLSDLRIPYTGKKRWELSQYGQYYRAGMIKPCPFTGVCFDEDFLESLQNDIKTGSTLGEAYDNLCDVARKLLENELDYQTSEEYFLEQDYHFTKDGQLIY